MPRVNNPKIGVIPCDLCGKPASVKQNSKTYLYVGCQDCGVDQRKGAKLQTRVYQDAQWLDGVAPVPPVNLITDQPKEPAAAQESAAENPKPEPKKEPEPESGNKGGWAVLAGLAAIILLPFKGGM